MDKFPNADILEINSVSKPQVLVFGSNIDTSLKASIVESQLGELAGVENISVDIENWERVLRVECNAETDAEMVLAKVKIMGFRCYELV